MRFSPEQFGGFGHLRYECVKLELMAVVVVEAAAWLAVFAELAVFAAHNTCETNFPTQLHAIKH